MFAIAYSILKFLADWLIHWVIPARPIPPVWSMVITIGIGTVIASILVFLLFSLMNRQQRALEQLNHELRNALQVLSYITHDSDPETRVKAHAAIRTISESVRRISRDLGMASEREYRPKKVSQ